jgi:hypothetical protein
MILVSLTDILDGVVHLNLTIWSVVVEQQLLVRPKPSWSILNYSDDAHAFKA